jgi:hypothetical protein
VYYREKGERLFQGRSKSPTLFHRVKPNKITTGLKKKPVVL